MTTLSEKYNQKLYWEILRKQGILKEILLDWLNILELKIRLYRERQQLQLLSDERLIDLGITRDQATRESLSKDLPIERLKLLGLTRDDA